MAKEISLTRKSSVLTGTWYLIESTDVVEVILLVAKGPRDVLESLKRGGGLLEEVIHLVAKCRLETDVAVVSSVAALCLAL